MRVEIILATPISSKLNGAAKEVLAILDDAGIAERRILDKSFCGTVVIAADVPEALFKALWRCERVISVRSDPGS